MVDFIRYAEHHDAEKIARFLETANLSSNGLEEFIEYFVLSEDEEGNVSSVLGIEPVQDIGILRSLVIRPSLKEDNLIQLFQHVYNLAVEKKLSTLYLVTNKEVFIPLLQYLGFQRISNQSAPKELEESSHVKHLSILTNIFYMKKEIE